MPKAIYLIVSGAETAPLVPRLITALQPFKLPCYTFLTDGAPRVIDPFQLARTEGHQLVESYFEPILLKERSPGITLVAPATFNTLNKISHGLADSLALSLVAEAIGAGWPVIIAPWLNQPLRNHPQTRPSLDQLASWGLTLIDPTPADRDLWLENIVQAVEAYV